MSAGIFFRFDVCWWYPFSCASCPWWWNCLCRRKASFWWKTYLFSRIRRNFRDDIATEKFSFRSPKTGIIWNNEKFYDRICSIRTTFFIRWMFPILTMSWVLPSRWTIVWMRVTIWYSCFFLHLLTSLNIQDVQAYRRGLCWGVDRKVKSFWLPSVGRQRRLRGQCLY